MTKLVVVVIPHDEKWFDIANAWETSGAPGITIIDSHGLYHLRKNTNIELQPMGALSLSGILRQLETNSHIVFSIVPDELVETLINRAMEITNLEDPYTGIAFVLDIDRVVGLRWPPE